MSWTSPVHTEGAKTPATASALGALDSVLSRREPSISELAAKPALRWPKDAAIVTGLPERTLDAHRRAGDSPRLYSVGRALFTTIADIAEWIAQHEVESAFRVRPGVRRKGDRRTK